VPFSRRSFIELRLLVFGVIRESAALRRVVSLVVIHFNLDVLHLYKLVSIRKGRELVRFLCELILGFIYLSPG